MSLTPTMIELVARARVDLRMGLPIVIENGSDTALAIAVESLSEERLGDLRELGDVTLALTARRAETLKARVYDTDVCRVHVPDSVSWSWIHALADPADDLNSPMKGPLSSLRGGNAQFARLAITLTKSARLLPSALLVDLPDGVRFAAENGLTLINDGLAAPLLDQSSPLHPVAAARLPIEAAEAGRLHIFRPDDGNEEHYAIEIGRPSREEPVLTRLHSACFTGDVLGSLKCDCGPQLQGALTQMGQEGAGVLLYLNQEGRGIGLTNKMRAYSLQDQGFDTVEANHRLGFEDDERDFRLGSSILKEMGFSSVRLLTNNPRKISMMESTGIQVAERVPLKVGENPFNTQYLATKARKSGHML
ncbi:GTP cyclohydrolase II [Epibacterium sp. SM1979]|uniref:GTP cyclohydrolase-2 n=1 Tax=Tritonibacter litoralis TaxID=2662264 RepID=A0A843YFS9_9RHOB|nr:GTP cyclohydrolase II [Tritonibacter litoralis]MQQ08133.1 GTP cyclohydrolase II [Tritonibacter litoralis]